MAHSKIGRNKKACEKYRNSGHKQENALKRKQRHEKRMARFKERKENGKCYKYNSENSSHVCESNINSKQARHTPVSILSGLFRKLDNWVIDEKKKEKNSVKPKGQLKKFRHGNDENTEDELN